MHVRPRLRRPLSVLVPMIVVLASLGGAWALTRSSEQRAPLAAALGAMPVSAATVDFTDWTRIEGSLPDLGLRGVTTRSVLAVLEPEMEDRLGWTVREIGWEAYGRLDGGAVTVIGLGDVSAGRAARSMEALGEQADDGVWRLDPDAAVSADFTATFGWVRLVPSRGLLIGAGERASVDAAVAAVDGSRPSLLDDRPVAGLARSLAGSDAVLLQERRFLCSDSSLSDPDVAQQLATVLDGRRLADPVWGGRGLTDGRPQHQTFAVAFDSQQVARQQVAARTPLTTGPFIGRSGQVSDSLVDGRVAEDDGVVSFDFAATGSSESFMTDTGPVAFAGCAPSSS